MNVHRYIENSFADLQPGSGCAVRARTKGRAKPQGVEQFELLSAAWVTRNQNTRILKALGAGMSTAAGLALGIKVKSNFFKSVG